MLELHEKNENVDYTNLSPLLDESKIKIAIKACESTPTISHYMEYVNIVNKSAILRRVADKLYEAFGYIKEQEFEKSQSTLSDALRCFDVCDLQKGVSAKEGFLYFCARQETKHEYYKTGLSVIDDCVYIDKGSFIILGGRPSSGKTALSLQMMLHMAIKNKVLYFSMETSPDNIFDRLIANCAEEKLGNIKRQKVENWEAVTNIYNNFEKLNFEVVPASGWTVEQIKSKSVQAKADIIFIDYLTLISEEGKSLYETATKISMKLHTFAQRTGTAIVALAQLNRGGEGVPTMASLRESGQIEQDADAIMLLYQEYSNNDNERKLALAKNKDGITGDITMIFDGARQKFSIEEKRY
jgi:replicative DNA helicase